MPAVRPRTSSATSLRPPRIGHFLIESAGKKIGELKDYEVGMDWDLEKTRVYCAVNLIGRLDELAVFNRPLTAADLAGLPLPEKAWDED